MLDDLLAHGLDMGQVAGFGEFLDEAGAALDVDGHFRQVGGVGDDALDEQVVGLGGVDAEVLGDAAAAALLPAFFGRAG